MLYPFGFGLSYDTFSHLGDLQRVRLRIGMMGWYARYSWEQLNYPMNVVDAEAASLADRSV